MYVAAWFVGVQTLMTFAVVFEFLSLVVFPCCFIFPHSTKWLWLACFLTAMISKFYFSLVVHLLTYYELVIQFI